MVSIDHIEVGEQFVVAAGAWRKGPFVRDTLCMRLFVAGLALENEKQNAVVLLGPNKGHTFEIPSNVKLHRLG